MKLLATSWHPGGINTIIPVVERLRTDGVDVTVIGHGYSETILGERQVQYRTIRDYQLPDVTLDSMMALLDAEKPDFVLTGTSTQGTTPTIIEHTITQASRQQKRPTLAIVDYWNAYAERFSDTHTGEKLKYLPDAVAVPDERAKQEAIQEGIDARRIIVTGNPHFQYIKETATLPEEGIREIRKEAKHPLAFYAGSAFGGEGYTDADNVRIINGVLRHVDAGVIVKAHPRTPEKLLDEIEYEAQDSDGKIRIERSIQTRHLVIATDVTITPTSTVGIEALLMGRPCISMQPNATKFYLTQFGIPIGRTPQECQELVRQMLIDEQYRKQLGQTDLRQDNATQKVIEHIYARLN